MEKKEETNFSLGVKELKAACVTEKTKANKSLETVNFLFQIHALLEGWMDCCGEESEKYNPLIKRLCEEIITCVIAAIPDCFWKD